MTDHVKFKRKVITIGDSIAVTIPPEISQWIGLEAGDAVEMQDENGKKGKFISIWKKVE